jgi:hypothetical protein
MNVTPTSFGDENDYNYARYSTTPNQVGVWGRDADNNYQFNPSKFDFSQLTYAGLGDAYQLGYTPASDPSTMPTVEKYKTKEGNILFYNPYSDSFEGYQANPANFDKNNLSKNYAGIPYFTQENMPNLDFQGSSVKNIKTTYYLDPKTGSPTEVREGGPFTITAPHKDGGGEGEIMGVIITVALVVTAVVAPEVIPALGTLITTGDTALAGAMLADSAVAGMATTEAVAAGSAAVGAASGAAAAGAKDKSIAEGALAGAGSGAAGSLASAGVGEFADTLGQTGTAIGQGAAKGAVSGFTGAELSGSNLQQALRSGEIGGATGASTSALSQGLQAADVPSDVAKGVTTAAGPFIKQDISNLFSPQTSSNRVGSSPTLGSSPTTGQAGDYGTGGAVGSTSTGGTTPGSQALAQALNVGDPSGPISTTEGKAPTQNVWNQASLRVKL